MLQNVGRIFARACQVRQEELDRCLELARAVRELSALGGNPTCKREEALKEAVEFDRRSGIPEGSQNLSNRY